MFESTITGKAWVCGDFVRALDICPERRWIPGKPDEKLLGRWALEDVVTDFLDNEWALKNTGCTIIVAGEGFGGGGRSMEYPIYALKGAGIQLVLADSFSRYNYRNSINRGLPVFVCEGVRDIVQCGDSLSVDLKKGHVVNQRTQQVRNLTAIPSFLLKLLKSGGILPYTKEQLEGKQDIR